MRVAQVQCLSGDLASRARRRLVLGHGLEQVRRRPEEVQRAGVFGEVLLGSL
jgi:hypothetical protein